VIQDSWLRVALALALCCQGGPASAAAVNGVRVSSGPESTRVVFELSAPADHRVFALADPDRIVIDLPNTSLAAPLTLPEAKGVVTALRTGSRPGGELRVVLELKTTAKPKSFLLAPNAQYGHRLVVDLVASGTAAVVRRAPEPVAAPRGRDLVIAIDAGHGGQDPGASGRNGAREKDIVLAIARRLAQEIDEQPGLRAVMIRTGDYFVSHRKRLQIAHDAEADFFISIHADAYRDSVAKGATVYVLSDKGASDEAALLLAQRENASDLLGGVSLSDKDHVLARVLLDLSQNAALTASMSAGQRLIKQMATTTPMRRLQVQQAPFLVLKSPDIPSVLVETAYISNPREEAALRSPAHQAALARALRAGILDYFAANPPPGSFLAAHGVQAAAPKRHVIARGETLSGIAERYRVSTSSLRRSNSLKNDAIRVGQVLTIPAG
jgi:N-acetylmuramoyl-L-alanine amidase